jgi:hypothetical protein
LSLKFDAPFFFLFDGYRKRTLAVTDVTAHEITVTVHDTLVASSTDVNRYVAKCKAAQDALEALQGERGRMNGLCCCSPEVDMEQVEDGV